MKNEVTNYAVSLESFKGRNLSILIKNNHYGRIVSCWRTQETVEVPLADGTIFLLRPAIYSAATLTPLTDEKMTKFKSDLIKVKDTESTLYLGGL